MSDSDDTDYLLLIPPNFFWVPSENEEEFAVKPNVDREIVDGLLSHVSSLENRVSAIESFENSLATDLEIFSNFTSPRIVKAPIDNIKENNHQDVLNWVRSNNFRSNREYSQESLTSVIDLNRSLTALNESNNYIQAVGSVGDLSAMTSPLKDVHNEKNDLYVPTKKLELTEVDRLLKEMELTQKDIESKLRFREQDSEMSSGDGLHNTEKARTISLLGDNIGSVPDLGFGVRSLFYDSPKPSPEKYTPSKPNPKPVIEDPCTKKSMYQVGMGLEGDSTKWKTHVSHTQENVPIKTIDSHATSEKSVTPSVRRRLPLANYDFTSSTNYTDKLASPLKSAFNSPAKSEQRMHERLSSSFRPSSSPLSDPSLHKRTVLLPDETVVDNAESNNESSYSRRTEKFPPHPPIGSEKLLSLNELWKGEDETISRNPLKLKQKLEEERYRRLHLENTVQALQKKVLEEQEKLAVAIQVDEKKDQVIEKVTDAWKKMVDHWKQIEEQRHAASQALLTERALSKRSQEELNKRVVRWEREVSQALDLAAGFKSKAENIEKDLISTREEFSNKLQESEGRIADAELLVMQKEKECSQLHEKIDETVQQLHEEIKVSEGFKLEVAKLEGCTNRLEAELHVIKEQRDLLAMRLKEETARAKLLEHQKLSLESNVIESAAKQKESEESCKVAKKHLESVKSELKALYQSQLESVVREKLAEFQSQLETARDDMRQQLDSELSAARETTRRQQQTLVNSHVAEMRRLESIHKEEMTCMERRLADAESRCARLELAKRDVAHKLHRVMENQWQQALGIITGELSMRQIDADMNGGIQSDTRTADMSQTLDHESPCKEIPIHSNNPQLSGQNQLLKYIEMMLDKHPGRPVDTLDSSILQESSEMLDESTLQSLHWNNRLRPMTQGSEFRTDGEKDLKKPPWK